MPDIDSGLIQEIYRKAKNGQSFGEFRFPYQDSYKPFNQKIIEAAEKGERSITFDFILRDKDNDTANSLTAIKRSSYRIYLSNDGGQAEINVFDYPSYLVGKGFQVDIIETPKNHQRGYSTKSYLISW